MVRKLEEKDRAAVMEYLSAEPSINLFALGDIELFGFDKEFQEVWGSFDKRGAIDGVLLRFRENFIPYYKADDFDDAGFKKIIQSFEGDTMISGKESIIENYTNLLPGKEGRKMYFCELTSKELLIDNSADIKTATVNDAWRIQALMETIEEFTRPGTQKEIEDTIKSKSGRIYYMEDDSGQMMSVSQTAAENSRSAMIVGIATAKEYRNRGLMSVCLSKLCADVLDEGKTLCLFYDNPKAGSVYHKLGFVSIDKWVMIH